MTILDSEYYTAKDTLGYTYTWNICGTINCGGIEGVGVCQVDPAGDNPFSCGTISIACLFLSFLLLNNNQI
jgi:hypothetical protein